MPDQSILESNIIKPITTNGSLTLQGDSSGTGVTGITIDSSGNTTFDGNLVIPDSGTIGSASATSALTIPASGIPDFPNGLTFASNAITGNITGVTLDDYEEGTFSGTIQGSVYNGTYTKIGRICHISMYIDNTSSTGTSLAVLPFSSKDGSTHFNGTQPTINSSSTANDTYIAPYSGGSIIFLYNKTGSTQNPSSGVIHANWVYETD